MQFDKRKIGLKFKIQIILIIVLFWCCEATEPVETHHDEHDEHVNKVSHSHEIVDNKTIVNVSVREEIKIQLDPQENTHHGDHEKANFHGHGETRKPLPAKVWAYGLICCTAVIVFARLGVIILPLLRKDYYEKLIIAMVGLAAGTLTGSSIFHLLPKAFSLEEKFANENYIGRCTVISLGIWAFLMIERVLVLLFHHKERRLTYSRRWRLSNVVALPTLPRRQEQSRVSVTSLSEYMDQPQNPTETETNQEKKNHSENDAPNAYCPSCMAQQDNTGDKYRLKSNQIQTIQFQEGSLSLVSTEAWMVIAGDCFLDFVDGLSIGTAFHDSILTGLSISLGVLLEELPHELGEFAVLLNAGLSFRQALVLKFLASCTTYLGLGVGIWLGDIEASPYVFALASGIFLYIALVDMVPELNRVALTHSQTSIIKGFRVLILQNIGLLLGISAIYVMAAHEDVFTNF